jgi:modulator of FtsH protease HflC
MKNPAPLLLIVGVIVLALLSSVFTVQQNQMALRTQFGEVKDATYAPGLHFKTPFVDQIVKFERRVLTQNYTGETFLTNEGRALIVDFYIKWQVKEARLYFETTGGDENAAGQRLADIVKDGIKNAVAQRTLQQIVAADRAAVTGDMIVRARESVDALGVQLVDVRVQRIDLPEDVAARVFESMKQNFERLARQLRGEGEKEANRIRSEADRKRTEILANAQRDALRVRGEGDAIAAQTYSSAYSKSPEFYAFYRSLQAYQNSLGKEGDVLVISPDSEFFRYLREADGGRR